MRTEENDNAVNQICNHYIILAQDLVRQTAHHSVTVRRKEQERDVLLLQQEQRHLRQECHVQLRIWKREIQTEEILRVALQSRIAKT